MGRTPKIQSLHSHRNQQARRIQINSNSPCHKCREFGLVLRNQLVQTVRSQTVSEVVCHQRLKRLALAPDSTEDILCCDLPF